MSVIGPKSPSAPRPAITQQVAPQPVLAVGTAPVAPGDAWEGVGTHSNPAVYESRPGVPATSAQAIARGEQQIAGLRPQVTRVYINPNILHLQDPTFQKAHPALYAEAQQQRATLQHLVSNALQSGSRVDLCLWNLDHGAQTTAPELKQTTDRFAQLVKQLEGANPGQKPGTFIVSAQNEPNRTKLAPQQVVQLYQDLDASLRDALGPGGRKGVRLIAGDMTGSDATQKWISGVVPSLAGKVDGFSFHVYAHNGETPQQLEKRLQGLHDAVMAAAQGAPKPPELLLTEYGVRGFKPGAEAKVDEPGYLDPQGQTPLGDTTEGALREAQLVIAAARTGFSGAIRWGANPGGGTPWSAWAMTGTEAQGYRPKPSYFVTRLFTSAIGQGWTPTRPEGSVPGESIASWRAPDGAGAAMVVANGNPVPQTSTLGGFRPGQKLQLLTWNRHGGGKLASEAVTADAQGEVRVTVAPGSVLAATSRGA